MRRSSRRTFRLNESESAKLGPELCDLCNGPEAHFRVTIQSYQLVAAVLVVCHPCMDYLEKRYREASRGTP